MVGPADAFEIDVDALDLRTEGAVDTRRRLGVTVRQVQATIAGVLLVCSSIACSTSDSIDDVSPSVDAGPVTRSGSGWFVGVEWAADASPDGEVCFELSSEPTDWTVPNTCWQPPFFDTWQQAASGSLRSAEGDDSIASLLIAGYDTEVQAVTQMGAAVPWMQKGRGLVVVTPFNVSGAAPVEISFVQGGETEVCSLGPPEVACLAG